MMAPSSMRAVGSILLIPCSECARARVSPISDFLRSARSLNVAKRDD
jgi:hypothetical protein